MTEAAQRGDAMRSLTRTAVAAYRYRAKEGEFPERLSNLTPKYLNAVPLDPYDGKAIRYRRAQDGGVLYSVGPDLADSEGRKTEFIGASQSGDWVFRLHD